MAVLQQNVLQYDGFDKKRLSEMEEISDSIVKTVECTICLDILSDPVSVGCGHFFCRNCIACVLKSKFRVPCPLCSKSFTKRCVQEASQRQLIVESIKILVESVKRLVEPERKKATPCDKEPFDKPVEQSETSLPDHVTPDCTTGSRKRKSADGDAMQEDQLIILAKEQQKSQSHASKDANSDGSNSDASNSSQCSSGRKKRRCSSTLVDNVKTGLHCSDGTEFLTNTNKTFPGGFMKESGPIVSTRKETFNVVTRDAEKNTGDFIIKTNKTLLGKNPLNKNEKLSNTSKFDEHTSLSTYLSRQQSLPSQQKRKFFRINKSKIKRLLGSSKKKLKDTSSSQESVIGKIEGVSEEQHEMFGDDLIGNDALKNTSNKRIASNNDLKESDSDSLHLSDMSVLKTYTSDSNSSKTKEKEVKGTKSVEVNLSHEALPQSTDLLLSNRNSNYVACLNECMSVGMEVELCAEEKLTNSENLSVIPQILPPTNAGDEICEVLSQNIESFVASQSPRANEFGTEDKSPEFQKQAENVSTSTCRSLGWSRIKQMNKDFHPKTFPSLNIQKSKSLPNAGAHEEQSANLSVRCESGNHSVIPVLDSVIEDKVSSSLENSVGEKSSVSVEHNAAVDEMKMHSCIDENESKEINSENKCSGSTADLVSCNGDRRTQEEIFVTTPTVDEDGKFFEQEERPIPSNSGYDTTFTEVIKCANDASNNTIESKNPKFARLSRNRNAGSKKSPVFAKESTDNKSCMLIPCQTTTGIATPVSSEHEEHSANVSATIKRSKDLFTQPGGERTPEQSFEEILFAGGSDLAEAGVPKESAHILENSKNNCIDIGCILQGSTGPFLQKVSDSSFIDNATRDSSVSHFCKNQEEHYQSKYPRASGSKKRHQKILHKPIKKKKEKTFNCEYSQYESLEGKTGAFSDNAIGMQNNNKNITSKAAAEQESKILKIIHPHERNSPNVVANSYQNDLKKPSVNETVFEKGKMMKDAEKTKVVKRICLTFEEIESHFEQSTEDGRVEIATVPLPFSDYKLQLTVADETLNVSVLKVVKSLSPDVSDASDSASIMLHNKYPTKELQKKIQTQCPDARPVDSEIVISHSVVPSPLGVSHFNQHASKKVYENVRLLDDDVDNVNRGHVLTNANQCQTVNEKGVQQLNTTLNTLKESEKISSCGFQRVEEKKNYDKMDIESDFENIPKSSFDENSKISTDVDIFGDLEQASQASAMEEDDDADVEMGQIIGTTSAVQESPKKIERVNDERVGHCVQGSSDPPVLENAINKQSHLNESLDRIECSFDESRNSLDVNLWPTVSAVFESKKFDLCENTEDGNSMSGTSKPDLGGNENSLACLDKSVADSELIVSPQIPIATEKNKQPCLTEFLNEKGKVVVDSPDDVVLSEDIDPFGDTCDFYKNVTTARDRCNVKFEEIIKESESYSSDPDMIFAADLVAPLRDIAKKMESSAAETGSSFRSCQTSGKEKLVKKLDCLKNTSSFGSEINFLRSSKKNTYIKTKKFKRITQVDSSDEDEDAPTQPYPGSNLKESMNKSNNSRSQELAQDGEDETYASLKYSTLDSEIPSDVANKMREEIEAMNAKLGQLQRAINEHHESDYSSDDDDHHQMKNSKDDDVCNADTQSLRVQESEESDLDLFTEQIPPTPPKDGDLKIRETTTL